MNTVVPRSAAQAFSALGCHQHLVAAEAAEVLAIASAADLYQVTEEAVFEGMEREIRVGHDGTPLVGEFLAAEIGAILGISPGAALNRLAEVLDVRHRLPHLWAAFLEGRLRWWQAANVARRCCELSAQCVDWLDRQLGWAMGVWPWQRILQHLDGWIISADPVRAEEREQLERERRMVNIGRIRDGHCQIWGTVAAADGIVFDHALTQVAQSLPVEGTLEQRRAAAVGVLARQAHGQDVLPSVSLVIHINASDPAMALDQDVSGVAEVEGWGAILTQHLPEFLAGSKVTVRPIIDPWAISPQDQHDPSDALRLAVAATMPHDVFPFGSVPAGRCDLDHTQPYRMGVAGQTAWGNLGPLSRYTHRVKTFGGWRLEQPQPGAFLWTSPHGYRYGVTPHGTVRISGPPVMEAVDPGWLVEPSWSRGEPPLPDDAPVESEAWVRAWWVLTGLCSTGV